MRARQWLKEKRPDRSPFWIGLSLSFLLFLWVLLITDPVQYLPTPAEPVAVAGGQEFGGHVDVDTTVPHESADMKPRVRDGLLWLARHQFDDGSWSAYYFHQKCTEYCGGLGNPSHDLGVTALSTLAFLESGLARRTVGDKDFEQVIRRALEWLARQQDEEGCFGPREGKFLYSHAIATMAYARAYEIFADPRYPEHVRGGIRFLRLSQNPSRAWRYGIRDGQNDTSVTGWAGSALLAAKTAGFDVPDSAFRGIRTWLDEVTDDRYYGVSYSRRGAGPSWMRGVNERFKRTEVLTAVGMFLRLKIGAKAGEAAITEGRERLKRDLPTWDKKRECVDYYYWYYGVRALSVARTENDPVWTWWSTRVRTILSRHQRKYTATSGACTWGSWDPVDKWGREGGRVYATALNVLTLSQLQ